MSKSRSPLPLLLLALNLLALPVTTHADEPISQDDRLRFTSFGTLGINHIQGDDLIVRRDLSQPEGFDDDWSWKLDSLVGGQLNADITNSLSLVVQGVFKSRPEQSLNRSIERAFLGWQVTPDLSLHAGRLGLDFYMLSDYRDVGFAYLWMRPPTEFYAPAYLQGVDGLDLVYRRPIGDGSLVTRLFGGGNKRDVAFDDFDTSTVNLTPVWGGSITFENERWRVKLGGARLTFGSQLAAEQAEQIQTALSNPGLQSIWPAASDYVDVLDVKGKTFGYYSLGATYDDNHWQVSGEIGYIDSTWDPVPDTESAYISIGRHFGAITPYVLLATVRADHGVPTVPTPDSTAIPAVDAQLALLHDSVQSIFQRLRFEQSTASIGARWDVHSNIALKFQWDHTEVEASGSGLWWNQTGTSPTEAATVNLVSASLNWMY